MDSQNEGALPGGILRNINKNNLLYAFNKLQFSGLCSSSESSVSSWSIGRKRNMRCCGLAKIRRLTQTISSYELLLVKAFKLVFRQSCGHSHLKTYLHQSMPPP